MLGSATPPLTVSLVQAFRSDSKDTPDLENQVVHFITLLIDTFFNFDWSVGFVLFVWLHVCVC